MAKPLQPAEITAARAVIDSDEQAKAFFAAQDEPTQKLLIEAVVTGQRYADAAKAVSAQLSELEHRFPAHTREGREGFASSRPRSEGIKDETRRDYAAVRAKLKEQFKDKLADMGPFVTTLDAEFLGPITDKQFPGNERDALNGIDAASAAGGRKGWAGGM